MVLPVLHISYEWNHIIYALCVWPLSFSIMFSKFIHIVEWSIPFPGWIIISVVWVYHSWFTLLTIGECLSCFQFEAIMNKAAMHKCVKTLCTSFYVDMFSNLLGIYLEMELQSHMISLCLTFWVMAKLFSIVTALFYPSANNVWGLISTYPCWCLISIIHFVVVILVGVKWYFFVALICSSLMVSVDDYFFHVLIVHLYIFFGEMSI